MPVLHLDDVPAELYERLERLAALHQRTIGAEALQVIQQGLLGEPVGRSQSELLADLRRRRFTPPPDAPDSVELL